MDAVKTLTETVAEVVSTYACASPNSTMYHLHDTQVGIDTVVVVPHKRQKMPYVVVMTRIEGDYVLIEADLTDRPLVEALIAAGIPQSRIVLAYQGESLPTP